MPRAIRFYTLSPSLEVDLFRQLVKLNTFWHLQVYAGARPAATYT